MKIADLFFASVTRDIPPVVYFHESDPERLKDEVGEYIITGGYKDGDPRAKHAGRGIHEEFVHLLTNLHAERTKKGGPELPASWISGFYGSGKSSFAKLLGYALDERTLPDGTPLADALLRRDESQNAVEFRDAWAAFTQDLNPVSVVFDIGGVARDDEHIHSAVLREVQKRLGYCSTNDLVADHELRLQLDGEWDAFLAQADKTLGRPWSEVKDTHQADDSFSHVLHAMHPDRYVEPMSWIDSRAGSGRTKGRAVSDTVKAIQAMLERLGGQETLFIVIDEVSQYVHDNEDRMLRLQSFVSELGQRLRGAAWLLVTGQQKLDDTGNTVVLSKLKDRFPERLRVHLSASNIRDVVHRRLLKKKDEHLPLLRDKFQTARTELKLYAFGCAEISEGDFIDVYPMLPGQIDLLLRITTNLRTRSSRVQGDTHAIRGLLQLLGELFREQRLAQAEVGRLITLDSIYDVLHTALDADVHATLARLFEHCAAKNDELGARVGKVVALLELVQQDLPTTAELVAQCLYTTLGQGSQLEPVSQALEQLRADGMLGYSEKLGYKIQSSAGQEWQRDREDIRAGNEHISGVVKDQLEALLGDVDKPRLGQIPLPWVGYFSDEKYAQDVRLRSSREDTHVAVDFRYVPSENRGSPEWPRRSDESLLRDRILWIVGDTGRTVDLATQLLKAQGMVTRHLPGRESLRPEKQRLLLEEQQNVEDLQRALKQSVADAFHNGEMFFRGRPIVPREEGNSFATALFNLATRLLPDIYPHFSDIAISPNELSQLLAPELSGPSTKFLDDGLGILSMDAGRYQVTCDGKVPARIFSELEKEKGMSGAALLSTFGQPPNGFAKDVVHACIAGLLRGGKLRVQPENGPALTSVRDPGIHDLFKDRSFKRANFFPNTDTTVGPRDRAAICRLFEQFFGVELERDNDAIADAVFNYLRSRREPLRRVEGLLNQLPGRRPLPPALERLVSALEQCGRERQVEPTVKAVKANLDALRDGLETLAVYENDLTDEAVAQVRRAADVRDHQLAQLKTFGAEADYGALSEQLDQQLQSERPWAAIADLEPTLDQISEQYRAVRKSILGEQEKSAEAARALVKSRAGFDKLGPDEAHHVLRPLTDVVADADPDAHYPALGDLHDVFAGRLEKALEEANARLDQALSKQDELQVVTVDMGLRGREVTSREQLDALLEDLRARILKELEQKRRVRLT